MTAAVIFVTLTSGCRVGGGWRVDEVRTRHAGEFACAPESVQVLDHSYSTYEARGCGFRAMYACVDAATCVRNSQATPLGGPPAQAAPTPTPAAQPQPPPGPDPDTTLRQGLQSRSESILSCTGGASTTVVASYDSQGNVYFSLGDTLSGTQAEACVRQQLGSVRVETGGRSGAVTETIAPPPPATPQPL